MPDRNYADEWLPSRFRLNLLRLVGYVVSRRLERTRPTSGAYLNREPGQHPLEAYLLAVAYWLVPVLQFTLLADEASGWKWFVAPLAFVTLLFVVPNAWVLIAFVFTPVASWISRITGRPNHEIQSFVTPTGMLLIAIVSIDRAWPGAALGWLWLVLTALELASLAVCLLLRGRFAALAARLPAEAP